MTVTAGFPGESNPNFPRNKSYRDNTVVKSIKKKKKVPIGGYPRITRVIQGSGEQRQTGSSAAPGVLDLHGRSLSCERVSAGSASRSGDVVVYVKDINQPGLPTPFYSVLVSSSVFMAHSTIFHFINSPDTSPLFHSVLPVLFLPYWSFQLYPAVRSCGSRN